MASFDNYLPCKSYQNQERDPRNPEFCIFQDIKTNNHYFAYYGSSSSEPLLVSEGYETRKSRDNGISSVLKNISNPKRWSAVQEDKKYYVILKAANGIEIARTCSLSSKKAADVIILDVNEGRVVSISETQKIDELEVEGFVEEHKVVELQAGELKVEESEVKKAKSGINLGYAPTSEITLLKSLSSFLEVNIYLNRSRIVDEEYGVTGFVKFDESGLHYFGVYNPDSSLYLRSEGYPTDFERENAFDLMESTILLEENYKVEDFDGKYYVILFEEDEILAISAPFESFIDAYVTTPGGRPKEHMGTLY